jgi:hypothetical protein
MELTAENKAHIDAKDHYQLLKGIRFSQSGDLWFQGETGEYWMKRYAEKKAENPGRAVQDSKDIGWER